jgi:hypothetical protein
MKRGLFFGLIVLLMMPLALGATFYDMATDSGNHSELYGPHDNSRFGTSLAFGDINNDGYNDTLISAIYYDVTAGGSEGAVYVFYGSSSTPDEIYDLNNSDNWDIRIEGSNSDAFGYDLATGDFNNDGYDDIVISAPNAAGGGGNSGEVYVIYGVDFASGTVLTDAANNANITIIGGDADDYLGVSLAMGDINNDGYDDVIAGGWGFDGINNAKTRVGGVFVIYGGNIASGTVYNDLGDNNDDANITIHGTTDYDQLCQNAGTLASGDINQDGYDDILIGSRYSDVSGDSKHGKVYILYGDNFPDKTVISSLTASANVTLIGGYSGDELGSQIRTGHINGDSYPDIIVNAWVADGENNAVGAAGDTYIIYGDNFSDGTVFDNLGEAGSDADVTLYGGASDRIGYGLAIGDINGDSFQDIVLGSYLGDGPGDSRTNSGDAYVLYGGNLASGTSFIINEDGGEQNITLYGRNNSDYFGRCISVVDLNNDNYDDIIIGAYQGDGINDSVGDRTGEVYFYYNTEVTFGGGGNTTQAHIESGLSDLNLSYSSSEKDSLESLYINATGSVTIGNET